MNNKNMRVAIDVNPNNMIQVYRQNLKKPKYYTRKMDGKNGDKKIKI